MEDLVARGEREEFWWRESRPHPAPLPDFVLRSSPKRGGGRGEEFWWRQSSPHPAPLPAGEGVPVPARSLREAPGLGFELSVPEDCLSSGRGRTLRGRRAARLRADER